MNIVVKKKKKFFHGPGVVNAVVKLFLLLFSNNDGSQTQLGVVKGLFFLYQNAENVVVKLK